ncbi:MAG: D-hexose-6-phosphate mutarotase, partial [Pseudomonadota bacterium]
AHGYARTTPWEVIHSEALTDGATRLVFRLSENEATRGQWPHATPVECHISVGTRLEIELVTRNAGAAPVTISQALHTYFAVSDIRHVTISGLDGCPYLDKVDGGKRKEQLGPVSFSGEVDRIYLDSLDACVIEDPNARRRIVVSKHGSRSTVVWNPWIEKAAKMGDLGDDGYLRMVCVESANAADDAVTIAPGAEHRLWARYAVEAL